jgi:hypothetical protein
MLKQELVKFEGDELLVATKNGVSYVSIKSVCDALGLDSKWQSRMVQEDEILQAEVEVTPFQVGGQSRQMVCLNLLCLHGWLFSIKPSRVKISSREKLKVYKRKCYKVLYDYFSNNGSKNANANGHKNSPQNENSYLHDIIYQKMETDLRIKELERKIENLEGYLVYKEEIKKLKKQRKALDNKAYFQVQLTLAS